jgi:hypothetical protein
VGDDIGRPFQFVINETSLDIFADGGTTKTRTKVWPAETVAAIPEGNAVGYSGFAPVVRAGELRAEAAEAGIDVNGVTVYYVSRNDGKQMDIQAQLNAFPVPDEQRVFVISVGV